MRTKADRSLSLRGIRKFECRIKKQKKTAKDVLRRYGNCMSRWESPLSFRMRNNRAMVGITYGKGRLLRHELKREGVMDWWVAGRGSAGSITACTTAAVNASLIASDKQCRLLERAAASSCQADEAGVTEWGLSSARTNQRHVNCFGRVLMN